MILPRTAIMRYRFFPGVGVLPGPRGTQRVRQERWRVACNTCRVPAGEGKKEWSRMNFVVCTNRVLERVSSSETAEDSVLSHATPFYKTESRGAPALRHPSVAVGKGHCGAIAVCSVLACVPSITSVSGCACDACGAPSTAISIWCDAYFGEACLGVG